MAEEIYQSIEIENNVSQQILEISQALDMVPQIFKFNLTMISLSGISTNFHQQQQYQHGKNNTQQQNYDKVNSEESAQFQNMIKRQLFNETQFFDEFSIFKADLQSSKSLESIPKQFEEQLVIQSQNQKIGIQQKNQKGYFSNQIVNPKLSHPTVLFKSVNKEIQENQEQSDNQFESVQSNVFRSDWHHQFPQKQKVQQLFYEDDLQNKDNKNLFKQFELQNSKGDILDQEQNIQEKFQSLINKANLEKTQTQTQQQSQSQIQITNISRNNEIKQPFRKASSPKFKLIVKQQKKKNTNQSEHLEVMLPKNAKKFEPFAQRLKKESKSVDKITLYDYHKKLSTSQQERETKSKPFDHSIYSQISTRITSRNSNQNMTTILYQNKKKEKEKTQKQFLNCSYQKNSQSVDQNLQYFNNDSFYEEESQSKIFVDLTQLQLQKQQSFQNYNSINQYQREQFSFKPQITEQQPPQNNNIFAQTFSSVQNQSPQGPNFKEQINTTNSQGQKDSLQSLRNEQNYFQPTQFSNFLYSQQQEGSGIRNNQEVTKSKKPIEIKLNIKQFVNVETEKKNQNFTPNKQNQQQKKKTNNPL